MGADDDDHVVLEHDAPKDAAALKAEKLAKLAKLKGEAAGAPAKRYRPDGSERFNHIHLTDDDDEHTAIAKGRHIPAPKPPPPLLGAQHSWRTLPARSLHSPRT